MSGGAAALPPEEFRDRLRRDLPRWNLTAPDPTVDHLASFLSELDRWRTKINLTGRLSADDLVSHALESVVGERFLPAKARVVDVGTGGGFPGVPLAIWRSDLDVTWLEPRERRVAFLRHLARTVPVANARVLGARVEDLPDASFAYATSRAVKVDRATFAEARFLERGDRLLLWLSSPERAAGDLASSGFELETTVPIPGSRQRTIGVFRKP